LELFFCGVRGSTPAPGEAYVRYGGHTSCVGLARDGGAPRLVLDGGTGLTNLDRVLGEAPFDGTILLGHLHWDHTHGLPFFAAGMRPGHHVQIVMPGQGADPERVLAKAFSPPHFPVEPSALGDGWSFHSIEEGEHTLEGFSVLAREIPHKGGRTFGYRVSDGTSSIAYFSDHHPLALGPGPTGLGDLHRAAVELASGVDLLIHDAQYTAEELPRLAWLGHSCPEYALALAEVAGARQVCLFHHSPRRTDTEIDELVGRLPDGPVPFLVAADGLAVRLGAQNGHSPRPI
jgi:phosphoribosyl 1,2-cyclic phosphodiesterase